MIDIGTLGGEPTFANAINDPGEVVGFTGSQPFLWRYGMMVSLRPPSSFSEALAINEMGQIVGYYNLPVSQDPRAFLWENGSLHDLNKLIPANSGWVLRRAYGINRSGAIVGDGWNPAGQYRAFILTPNGASFPPVAYPDAVSVDEDTLLNTMAPGVLANDRDADGSPLTAVIATQPANGSVTLNSDGSFTYTPNANFHGMDSFTYLANDGQLDSAPATVTITVHPVNDAPDAVDDTAEAQTNTPTIINVLYNDGDVDGDTLSVIEVTQPANGSATLNADGTITYKSRNNFAGQDSLTYTISDGNGGVSTATVTVTVSQPNRPPRAFNDKATTAKDTPVVIAVLANDQDPDGDVLTVTEVTQPDGGVVVINANGTVTYTPNAGFRGHDTLTYTVSDGRGGFDKARVNVQVR